MQIYIDNKNIKNHYGIDVLDYRAALGFAGERENERVWHDKSGVDRDLFNNRYDAREFVIELSTQAATEGAAHTKIAALIDYIFSKGVFVLSLRDSATGYRKALLCERSGVITGNGINIREQNSIYTFTLGLKDVNPNAVTYYNTIVGGLTSIIYDKGQNAYIYWGDGTQAIVSNSQTYYKSGYAEDGDIDIIIDIDKDATAVTSLDAQFSANIVNGAKDLDVQFTDTSTGSIVIWAWDFGDGFTSAEQSPQHTYTVEGTYTVTLQVFNAAQGSNTETKVAYITVTNSQLLINGTDAFLVNATDILLKNG